MSGQNFEEGRGKVAGGGDRRTRKIVFICIMKGIPFPNCFPILHQFQPHGSKCIEVGDLPPQR